MGSEDCLLRKEKKNVEIIIRHSAFCQLYQKYLEDVCLEKYQTIWTITYQNISADLKKFITHKIVFCPCLTNGKGREIIATDLSKAFHCLSHELAIAKLHTYDFSFATLRLMHSYLRS